MGGSTPPRTASGCGEGYEFTEASCQWCKSVMDEDELQGQEQNPCHQMGRHPP